MPYDDLIERLLKHEPRAAARLITFVENDVSAAEEIIKKNPSFSVLYIPEINETFEYIKKEIKNNTVLMIIGAGDIYKLSKLFSLDRNNTKLHNKKKD